MSPMAFFLCAPYHLLQVENTLRAAVTEQPTAVESQELLAAAEAVEAADETSANGLRPLRPLRSRRPTKAFGPLTKEDTELAAAGVEAFARLTQVG